MTESEPKPDSEIKTCLHFNMKQGNKTLEIRVRIDACPKPATPALGHGIRQEDMSLLIG